MDAVDAICAGNNDTYAVVSEKTQRAGLNVTCQFAETGQKLENKRTCATMDSAYQTMTQNV